MTSTARTASTRTVDGNRMGRTFDPRPTLSGLVAAGQALVLSLSVVVLPAVVAFLVSPSGVEEGTGWGRSVTVGASLWLLGHGVPLKAGGGLVTLVPLGLTALAVLSCYASARRSAFATLRAWLLGTAGYGVVVLVVAVLAGATSGMGLVMAGVGGVAVGAVGLGCGLLSRPDAPRFSALAERLSFLPAHLRLGLRGGSLGVSLLVALAALLVVLWVFAGRATSADIVTGLAPGIAGGAILAVAQTTLLPNFVVWAMAWIAGPGFAVGSGTSFTSTRIEPGTLPAVPLLGALPGEGWTNAATALAPAAVVALGIVVGFFVLRHRPSDGRITWADAGWAVLGVAVASFILAGCLVGLASGSVGVLTGIGANVLQAAGVIAGEVTVGAGCVLAWSAADVPALVRPGKSGRDSAEASKDTR